MALDAASAACDDWDRLGGEARAGMLERAADLFEADRAGLMAFLVREAGKTLANAQSDLREAIDHLRFSAVEARRNFTQPRRLKGPTGEENELSLRGRGVCLSRPEFPHLHRSCGRTAA
jgi:RHH-type proline utilization regulon transcriptional repressor/proline dehydrogenase/delta 1-pyrroline-5-carboxylate dehydrogenase